MAGEVEVSDRIEIIFSVQGNRPHFGEQVERRITVAEFGAIAARVGAIEGAVEVFLEDADEPLNGDLILIEQLSVEFTPLHVAPQGAKIAVKVEYNLRDVSREFRPNVTIERITRWAIGPDGLKLEGDPSDYQMKYDGEVLPPEMHLGQVPHPHREVTLNLVFKVKPQGDGGAA